MDNEETDEVKQLKEIGIKRIIDILQAFYPDSTADDLLQSMIERGHEILSNSGALDKMVKNKEVRK